DKKKVEVTEATIREALHLDDAEGMDCLSNEEIFTELARMGYEKPSTKLTFYKAFFSSHLVRNVDSTTKFYMYPHFLQLIIKKQVGNLSTYTPKYTSPALTQKVFANMRRVGKGFSEVETYNTYSTTTTTSRCPFNIPGTTNTTTITSAMDACAALTRRVEHLEFDKVAQALEIIKLKRRVKTPERRKNVRVLKLRRLKKVETSQRVETSDDTANVDESAQDQVRQAESQAEIYKIDMDHTNKVLSIQEDETEPAEVQEVVDVVTTTKLITEVVTADSETVTAASAIITSVEAQVPTATLIAAPARVIAAPSRR
nr:hypothetical protein [Tanacetum cinerariifolium]